MVMETYLILATGKTHSEIRDEFCPKGRISLVPAQRHMAVWEGGQTLGG